MAEGKAARLAIGRRVTQLRNRKSWSQLKLSLESGVHINSINGIEKGRTNWTIRTLCKLAVALGVPWQDVLRPPERGSPGQPL